MSEQGKRTEIRDSNPEPQSSNEARRLAYLRAIGIDVWVPRAVMSAETPMSAAIASPTDEPAVANCKAQGEALRTRRSASLTNSALASAPAPSDKADIHTSSIQADDIHRPSAQPISSNSEESRIPSYINDDVAQLGWDALRQRVSGCTLCPLHKTRTQTVFGVGSHTADWLFIGEAPGADEDRKGEPFVGRAGQLLNNMLRAIGLSREQVYIANILKCRPPKNRDPKPEEAHTCEPYLKRQIDLLRPKIIVALGRVAGQNLLNTDAAIGQMRGRQYVYADTSIPLLVTYHPAYLLRSPGEKRKAWNDLLMAQKLVEVR
ncbi:MAG: uracil-DNA glycosylase [Pseudomonadota bacterium]|nr:uracil-DNA glycosylase [Pseudomonadota bacterium]